MINFIVRFVVAAESAVSLKQQSNSPLRFPLKVKNRLERSVEVRVEVTRKQGFSKHRFDRVFFFQDSNSPRQSGLSSRTGKSLFSELTASVFTSLGKYRADLEWLSLSLSLFSSSFFKRSLSAEGTFVSLDGTRGIRLNESVGRIMERTCRTLKQIREGFTPLDTPCPSTFAAI